MDIRKLQRVVVDALEDVKAQDIRVYHTTELSNLFDRVILASATSNRHARALASKVVEEVKKAGGGVISVEGGETGEWVLVDLGDAVVHVMQTAVRAYYALEEIWGGKPVALRSRTPAAAPARKPRKAPARKRASPTRAKKAPARRS
jgi:ribosome-associated protein